MFDCTAIFGPSTISPHSLDRAQAELDALHSKQGRITRFRSRAERDAYIKTELASIDAFDASITEQAAALQTEHDGTRIRAAEYGVKASDADRQLEDRKQNLLALAEEIADLKRSQSEKNEQRKYVRTVGVGRMCSYWLLEIIESSGVRKLSYSSNEIMPKSNFVLPKEP